MSLEEKIMMVINALVKRHIFKFLRDKAAVFTSLLSVIILLALYFLFIGRQYTEGIENLSEPLKTQMVIGVMMGGILVINTISLSLGVMGNLVVDIDQKKLVGFLVAPIPRYKIILSYYISAIIVTSVLTLLMWALTIMYAGIFVGYWYPFSVIFKVSLLVILYTFVSTAMMVFLTTLIKSVNAFGTLSGVLGTLIGFLSGIYMPLIVLGQAMIHVASLNPFTHMSILLKQVLLEKPFAELVVLLSSNPNVENPTATLNSIKVVYGAYEIGVLGQNVSLPVIFIGIAFITLIFLFLSYRNMNKKVSR
jgi:multidrug/hemolysin transport system permease protein